MTPRAFVILALLSAMGTEVAQAQHGKAKIAAHVVPYAALQKGQTACTILTAPPCNEGESNLNVSASVGTEYWLYLLVLDAHPVGVAGASFGIAYRNDPYEGVSLLSWTECSDQAFTSNAWPDSGTSIEATWHSNNNCQTTPATGDLDGTVTSVVGAFRMQAYSADTFTITRRTDAGGEFAVASCLAEMSEPPFPRHAGSVGFGGSSGYDPCKGPLSPISSFDALDVTNLQSVSIKLCYVGPQLHSVPAVALCVDTTLFDLGMYSQFQRSGEFGYINDIADLNLFMISDRQCEAIIDSVVASPEASMGANEPNGVLSLAIVGSPPGGDVGFESVLTPSEGRRVFSAILDIMSDTRAKADLEALGCISDCYPVLPIPLDVTSEMEVSLSGFRKVLNDDVYLAEVNLKNVSAAVIPSPLVLVPDVGGNLVRIVDEDGFTCRLSPEMRRYIEVSVPGGLQPGAAVEVEMKVSAPEGTMFQWNPVVYSGEGVR